MYPNILISTTEDMPLQWITELAKSALLNLEFDSEC